MKIEIASNPIVISNPKSMNDYLSMYSHIIKCITAMSPVMEEMRQFRNTIAFYRGSSNKNIPTPYSLVYEALAVNATGDLDIREYMDGHFKYNVESDLETYPKNNQIEQVIKWKRARMAWGLHYFSDRIAPMRSLVYVLNAETEDMWKKIIGIQNKINNNEYFPEGKSVIATIHEKIEDNETKVQTYQAVIPLLEKIAEAIEPFKGSLKKYFDEFNRMEGFVDRDFYRQNGFPTNDILNHNLQEIRHFIELYRQNPERYKKLNDFSWAGKTPGQVKVGLEEIAEEIALKHQGDDYTPQEIIEYKELWENEKGITSEYMTVENNLVWYRVKTNSSRFESFIGTKGPGSGQHCGVDSSATHLFSLRSKNKDGLFILHATVSAMEHDIGEEAEERNSTGSIFEVIQIKTTRNMPVHPRYWEALLHLFSNEEFGFNTNKSVYGSQNSFNISWLLNIQRPDYPQTLIHDFGLTQEDWKDFKKMYKEFVEYKPWWNDYTEAKRIYDIRIYQKQFINYIKHPRVMERLNNPEIAREESTLTLTWDLIEDMLKGVKSFPSDDVWENLYKWISDYDGYDVQISRDDYDDFISHISNKYPQVYKKLLELVEKTESADISELLYHCDTHKRHSEVTDEESEFLTAVDDSIVAAFHTGWDVGYENSKFESVKSYFDGKELKAYINAHYEEDAFATIQKNTNGTWSLTFDLIKIEAWCEEHQDVGIPTPEIRRREADLEVYPDFDYAIAMERLDDELPSNIL